MEWEPIECESSTVNTTEYKLREHTAFQTHKHITSTHLTHTRTSKLDDAYAIESEKERKLISNCHPHLVETMCHRQTRHPTHMQLRNLTFVLSFR